MVVISKKLWLYTFLTTSVISVYLYYYMFMDNCCVQHPSKIYTHIIVGAGTAGCVLAARLSENKNNTVLLIEAGSTFNFLSEIPLLVGLLQGSSYDWSYKTTTQKSSSFGLVKQQQSIPRGKGLGGSSQINYLVHGFLEKQDLELWNELGAANFIANVTQFYNSLERTKKFFDVNQQCNYKSYVFFYEATNESLRSISNDNTRYPSYVDKTYSELTSIFKNSIKEINMLKLQLKYSFSTTRKGRRWSVYHSHLEQSLKRRNLHILCNTYVNKIILNKNKAIGIDTVSNKGIQRRFYSTSDIIISAGSINTPKLLLLSGIGNATDLRYLNIPVRINLPGVGRNLHDHLNMPLFISVDKPVSVTLNKVLRFQEFWRYFWHNEGLLGTNHIAGIGYIPLNLSLILFGMSPADDRNIFRTIANYKPDTYKSVFPFFKNSSQEGFVFLTVCAQPKSRGSVKLLSKDPKEDPIIDPNYLHEVYDTECMKSGVKLMTQLINTGSFKSIGSKIHWPVLNECKDYKNDPTNEKYLECIIRTVALSGYHLAGTCKMGKNDDIYSVVDSQFRVKGTTNLRIVDASIFPTPVSSFPNAILIAIAEYASELLMNRY